MADDDNDTRLNFPVGISLTQAEGARLTALADGEKRKLAAMARILLMEAIDRRPAERAS